MDFKTALQEKTQRVELALNSYFPVGGSCPDLLSEAMAYSVFAGGKRLRPVLLLGAYEALGGRELEKALPFACALELIHTYSLIHDDLPAMDNDDLRRGKPTNHKVFGEDMAILAGDGLLSYAFSILSEACTDLCGVRAMAAVAKGAGVQGMVAGQVVDVKNDGKPVDRETLAYIHTHKTAAMLIGALTAGGCLANAEEARLKTLEEAGLALGLAFQIQDDILDVIGDEKTLGKPVHSDAKNQKTTYATFFGLEGAAALADTYSQKAMSLFSSLGPGGGFLSDLTAYLTKRAD